MPAKRSHFSKGLVERTRTYASPFSSVRREIAEVGLDRAQATNSPFPVPNCSEDRSESGYRFSWDTGFGMRREAQVAWCDSKLENLEVKIETRPR